MFFSLKCKYNFQNCVFESIYFDNALKKYICQIVVFNNIYFRSVCPEQNFKVIFLIVYVYSVSFKSIVIENVFFQYAYFSQKCIFFKGVC